MNLDEIASGEAQHGLVMGDPKSGKSTLVSDLAKKYKITWVSMDNGHRVLYKLPEEARKNINLIVLPDTRAWPVAFDTVRKMVAWKDLLICLHHGSVDCSVCKKLEGAKWHKYTPSTWTVGTDILVFDHISQLGDSCMNVICKDKKVDYKPQLDDWGSLRFFMAEVLTAMQQSPFNIICLSHVIESEMEDGRKKLVPQVGSRETSKTIGKYFDHMIYCEVVNKSHKSGSGSTYSSYAMTGSRTDFCIENEKENSLIPMFSLPVQNAAAEKDKKEAVKVLVQLPSAKVAKSIEAIPKEIVAAANVVELAERTEDKVTLPKPANTAATSAKELLARLTAGKKQ